MITKNLNSIFETMCYVLVLYLVINSMHNSFFWDTVQLASKHANFYYSNHFSSLLLPIEIDSGHIPTFGIYIALIWKIFGRSLEISHLAILPFALGIVFQMYRLCQKFIPTASVGLSTLLILADPSLLSQITLVSPDVCLVFFFLLGINAILDNKKPWIVIAVFCLFLTSMRGMMISLCLVGLDIHNNINLKETIRNIFYNLINRSMLYSPALLLFIAFSSYHYLQTGWIGFHGDSPWSESFERIEDGKSFLFNLALYAWRLLDFGRVGIWFVAILLIVLSRKQLLQLKSVKMLVFFAVVVMIVLPANMLWAKNLIGHRYLIPIYITISLLAATLLFSNATSPILRYVLSIFWISCLISGNFIIYQDKIAKGWDATLAHLPYYELRHQTINFLENKKIDFKKVQSFFPNVASIDEIDLNHDQRNFNQFDGKSEFVFYSNIFNVTDEEYDLMHNSNHYREIFRKENSGVFVVILQKIKQ